MSEQRITPFLFEGEAMVRVIERDSAPWFVAKDVCGALGIIWKGSDSTGPLGEMDADERGISSIETPSGRQEMVVVSESGLYAIIFKSRKPEAVRFRKWVTAEVLPSIRQTGRYEIPTTATRPFPAAMENKPFWEWTLEEVRTHLAVATNYRLTLNTASAAWYLMAAGFPRPPRKLMPVWWQADMDLREASVENALTITVPLGGKGGTH